MTLEVVQVYEDIANIKISTNSVSTRKQWNCDEIVVNNIFAYEIALDVMNERENHEPKSIEECQRRQDWPKWKDAIQPELSSLAKREVFGPIVQTPEGVKPVGY